MLGDCALIVTLLGTWSKNVTKKALWTRDLQVGSSSLTIFHHKLPTGI